MRSFHSRATPSSRESSHKRDEDLPQLYHNTLSSLSTAVQPFVFSCTIFFHQLILENFLSRFVPSYSPSFTLGINSSSFSFPRRPLTYSDTLPPPEGNWWWGSLVLRDQSTQSFGRVSVPAVSRFGVPVKGLKRVNSFKNTRCRYSENTSNVSISIKVRQFFKFPATAISLTISYHVIRFWYLIFQPLH